MGARRTLALGAAVVGYIAILALIDETALARSPWPRLLLPNAWLIGWAVAWRRLGKRVDERWSIALTRGGRRPSVGLVAAGLALALPLVIAGAWSSGRGAVDDAALVRHLVLALLVPVAEELYFRGILLEHLAASLGPLVAVIAVGALFGLLHWPQGLLLPMTVLSVVLCLVTLATRSALWAVALHVGWNAAAVVRSLPGGPERWAIAGAAAGAILIITLLALRQPSRA